MHKTPFSCTPDVRWFVPLDFARELERELAKAKSALPKLNIRCDTQSDGILGSTYLDVVKVEREDDDSLTAVTNYWPNNAGQTPRAKPEGCL